ncbi:MAG TPA: amidohydrolase family protein [Pyrinomonadaceae bacterium]|nr:amidohydrolase family protein [Pyrinomonadaceae bacterium]
MYRNLIKKFMQRSLAFLLILVLTPAVFWASPLQSGPRRALVFTHVNVIDPAGTPLRREMTVIIRDERIVALGKTGRIAIPRNSEVIDATGKFMIPGLWDMHAHLGTDDFDKQGHLPLFVANGVTGIRIMDGDPAHHRWRDEITSGSLIGPRMVIGSAIIGQSPIAPAAARAAVRQAKNEHADFVKVHEALSREAYFAIIDEARKEKLTVAGHVPLALTAVEVATVGQKSIEHFTGLEQAKSRKRVALALAALLRQYHTWLCPTLIMRLSYASLDDPKLPQDPRLKYVKPSWVRRWLRTSADAAKTPAAEWQSRRALVQQEKELVGLMYKGRVGILAGTDEISPFCAPGFSLHDELALFVEAGLTPMQALQTATLNPARFLNRQRDLGTIAPGKLADLVLLDANPLVDIRNTQKINSVVVNGRLLTRKALDDTLSKIAAAAKMN